MISGTDMSFVHAIVYILRELHIAGELAVEHKHSQTELWAKICSDEYMGYAVLQTFHTLEPLLLSMLNDDGRRW